MRINPDVDQFMQGYTRLLANWGVPLTAARVLSFLMLQSRPLSLDEIAEGMGISKAGAWGAAKHLEQVGEIERFGESGTKRALFAVPRNPTVSVSKFSRLLRKSSDLARQGTVAAMSPAAARRLRETSAFLLAVHEAIENTVEQFRSDRRRAASE